VKRAACHRAHGSAARRGAAGGALLPLGVCWLLYILKQFLPTFEAWSIRKSSVGKRSDGRVLNTTRGALATAMAV
jgi:hypothetical protein